MGNLIKAALEKVGNLELRYEKMAGIFEKSKTKRAATIAKLEAILEKCKAKQLEIEAKEAKVMEDLAAKIAIAKTEHETLKAEIVKVAQEAKVEAE